MASFNRVIIMGNCGRDPEVRYLPSGQAVANVSVATSSKWKDKSSGEMVEDTQWHRVTFFDRLAEIAGEYVKKGSSIHVEGRLQYRKYTNKDGVEMYSTDIIATGLQLVGGRPDEGGGDTRQQQRPAVREPERSPGQRGRQEQGASRPASKPSTGFDDMDDDIPFLFNVSAVSDTLGSSKSRHRIKHGPKALHILRQNEVDC